MTNRDNALYKRRQYQRYPCAIPVKVTVDSGSCNGTAVNIGLGGMLIVTENKQPQIQVETNVRLCFRIPSLGYDTEVMSCVRWSNENSIGVQFIGLEAKDVFGIRQFTDDWQ